MFIRMLMALSLKWDLKKLTKIHRKADSSLSTHSLALLTNAQERKTGHQFKFAICSWQKFAPLLYDDMALPCCNIVYHMLHQSGAA